MYVYLKLNTELKSITLLVELIYEQKKNKKNIGFKIYCRPVHNQ